MQERSNTTIEKLNCKLKFLNFKFMAAEVENHFKKNTTLGQKCIYPNLPNSADIKPGEPLNILLT